MVIKLVSGKIFWLGGETSKENFPMLYVIVRRKNTTVAQVFSTISLNVSFRRALTGGTLVAWLNLVSLVVQVTLKDGEDIFSWNLQKNGSFSVRRLRYL